MPGLVQRSVSQFGNATAGTCSPPVAASGSVLPNGVWSKQRDDIGFDQLQKFWSELLPHARQELLRIDKHTLFEQARKNLYCSRCNGLLLEGFTQIVMYGKSLQREAGVAYLHNKIGDMENDQEKESDEAQDPSVHPWGGLVASRDGTLTLMDCYLYGKSLWVLQNVFDSARARERERELLYPDACGGGGRGWISHGMANYGRVHGVRETCALHTARLSCDTLVDFWSALGDETRLSLLRMKEEDFIERLMYRFDSKRFCRDCRKNVIREFKELKELKRMRRQTRCTSWFCVADTAFQYEVSKDTVQADWRHSFADSAGTYHHFEWAIGTSEGKSDILEFEDAGLTGEVQVNGVELEGLDACFITLRAWRLDGRCTELTVKAHALKGKPCVHQRLVVGDGFVTITKGENIRSFFERAEEAEEEEDDDPIDKDGNELDGDGSRPQKHAKSPELAREFLLDAATVIFKEQVEKAFREGTARQNAHSIFVCLALKLLEERVHVACKEIITLEKQVKLLEEEEKEKREEEERRERRRAKEREKKLRRKERLRGKEREKERKDCESDSLSAVVVSKKESSASAHEKTPKILDEVDPNNEAGGCITASALSGDTVEEQFPNGSASSESGDLNNAFHSVHDGEMDGSDTNGSFILEQSKSFRRKLRFNQNLLSEQANEWSGKHKSAIGNENNIPPGESETTSNGYSITSSRCISGGHRHSRANIVKTNARNCGLRFSEKFHSSKSRIRERYDYHYCSCNQHVDYRAKDSHFISTVRSGREIKAMNTTETPLDASRSVFHSSKYSYGNHANDNSVTPKPKIVLANSNILRTKKVWEPTDSRKKCLRNESDPSPGSRTPKIDSPEQNGCTVAQNAHKEPHVLSESCLSIDSSKPGSVQHDDCSTKTSDSNAGAGNLNDCSDAFHLETKSCYYKDVGDEEVDSCSVSPTSPMDNHCDPLLSSSSSDNCSSCLSEADSSSSSSTARNAESSSTSDSEDVSPQFEGRDAPICNENVFLTSQEGNDKDSGASFSGRTMLGLPFDSCSQPNILRGSSIKDFCNSDSSLYGCEMAHRQQQVLPMHNHNLHSSYVPFPTMSYHNQNPASWSATADNGVLSFAQPHHYLFPSSIGYGLPANQPPDFCLPYSGLQPLATPMLSVRHPVYQTVKQVNIHNSNEQMKNFKVGGDQQGNGMTNAKKSAQTLERPMLHSQQSKPQSTDENVNDGASSKLDKEIPSFSLFHFGGPVAVASGNNLDSLSLKNESTQEAETDNACLKKDIAVEEYSLFASRNGSRFSFF